MATGQSRDGG
uniref:Uncharacterized protein n=1 Tax=Arundo donax TaxID=35708 RepID=A0A0A9HNF0_ARUDO